MARPQPWKPTDWTTPEDVRQWLADLHQRGLLWHMDDDPLDCVWGRSVTRQQKLLLARQQDRARAICQDYKVDIFAFYPDCSACGKLKGTNPDDCETCADDSRLLVVGAKQQGKTQRKLEHLREYGEAIREAFAALQDLYDAVEASARQPHNPDLPKAMARARRILAQSRKVLA